MKIFIVICILVGAASAGNITEIIRTVKALQAASGDHGGPDADANILNIILTYKALREQKKAQSLRSYSDSNGYGYSAPASSYSAPAISYSEPSIGYSAPAFGNSAPAVSYSVPAISSSYSAPALSYSSPVSYSAPAPSYSAPAVNLGGCRPCQSAGISSQISDISGGYGGGYASSYPNNRW